MMAVERSAAPVGFLADSIGCIAALVTIWV